LTVARLQAIFGADTRPAEQTLSKFTGFAKHTFSTALGMAAAMGGQALVRGFTHLAAEGLQATATFERMQMSLQALAAREIKSANAGMDMNKALELAAPRAQELFQWAKKLAIQSPFSAEGVVNAMKTAMAYGITSKQAQKLTQNMIDFASATGASEGVMTQIARALGQMYGKNRVLGDELRQLTEAGVPVNDILHKMGYSLMDLGKKSISAKQFLAAFSEYMDETVKGAAKRQAESWAGLMNTFDDLKKQGLAAFFEGALRAVKPLTTALSDWLQGPGLAKLKDWGKSFGEFTSKVVFGARLLASILSGNIGQLSGMLTKLGVPRETQTRLFKFLVGFQRGMAQLKAAVGGLVRGLVQRFAGLGKALGSLKGSKALAAFREYLERLGDVFSNLWGQIQPLIGMLWEKVTGWFRENRPLIDNFIATVYGAAAKLVGFLASQVAPVFGMIKPLVMGLVDVILGLAKTIMQVVTGDWAGAWETLKQVGVDILIALQGVIMGFVDWIAGWFGTSWQQIEAVWRNNWAMLQTIVQAAVQKVVLAVKTKWDEMKTATVEKIVEMADVLKTKWEEIKTTAEEKWDVVKEILATALGDMVQAVADKATAMYQKGIEFIKGFWDGLKAKWHEVEAWVNEHFGWILTLVRSIYDSHSPSRKMMKLGADIMDGLRLGLEDVYRRTNWAQYFDVGGALTGGAMRVAFAGATPSSNQIARHYGPVNITIQAASDPEETAREVVRMLRLNGWV